MKRTQQFTAIIEREEQGFVSLCPELDIASQGNTVEEAKSNLAEALELFFEVADSAEIAQRLSRKMEYRIEDCRYQIPGFFKNPRIYAQ